MFALGQKQGEGWLAKWKLAKWKLVFLQAEDELEKLEDKMNKINQRIKKAREPDTCEGFSPIACCV